MLFIILFIFILLLVLFYIVPLTSTSPIHKHTHTHTTVYLSKHCSAWTFFLWLKRMDISALIYLIELKTNDLIQRSSLLLLLLLLAYYYCCFLLPSSEEYKDSKASLYTVVVTSITNPIMNRCQIPDPFILALWQIYDTAISLCDVMTTHRQTPVKDLPWAFWTELIFSKDIVPHNYNVDQ